MVKNWIIYILLFIAATAFFIYYQMWLAWYCMMIVLLVPIVALIMTILNGIFTTVSIETPKAVKLGEDAAIVLKSKNTHFFHFGICRMTFFCEELMYGEKMKKKKIEFESRGEKRFPIDTTHCGTYVYTAPYVRVYDLFRLFFVPKKINLNEEVVIRPNPVIPALMPDSNGFKARMLKKSNASYSEIYDVRDYVVGDPIKNIHWKLTAKKDKVLVKEPQEGSYGHARVYLALQNDREEMDKKLGELLFTSSYFLSHDIEHRIRILPPMKREISFDIESQRDLDTAILKILHLKMPKEKEQEKEKEEKKAKEKVKEKKKAKEKVNA